MALLGIDFLIWLIEYALSKHEARGRHARFRFQKSIGSTKRVGFNAAKNWFIFYKLLFEKIVDEPRALVG